MRSEDKAQRARRKLRALQQSKRRARSFEPDSILAPALANAVAVAQAAYGLCARKTRDPNVAVAANNAAASLAASFDVKETPRLGDRLRLEWLAALPDADTRLLGECARMLTNAIGLADDRMSDRLRLASAEAFSLTRAVASEAGWRSPATSVAFLSFAR